MSSPKLQVFGGLRKSDFANAIIETSSGTAVALTDVSPFEHILRVKASSQNLIPFPYHRTSGTYEGVAFTVNNDTSITMKGTAENNIYFYLVIGNAYGTTSMNASTNASATNGEYVLSKRLMYFAKDKETFVYIAKGETVDETIYPMLAKGTILPPWTPSFPDFSSTVKLYTTDDYVYSRDGDKTETPTRSVFSIDDLDKFIAKSIEQGRTYQNGKESFSMRWETNGYFYIGEWTGESDALLNEWGIESYGFAEDSEYIIFEVINRDYSKANVQRYGKNLIPYPFYSTSVTRDGVTFTDNGDGGIALKGTATKDISYCLMYQNAFFGSGYINAINAEQATNLEYSANKRLYYDSAQHNLFIIIGSGVTVDEVIYPQVEMGSKFTEYEPPANPTTYSINADGTVEGVKSIYPTTTLIPDTAGVMLDVEYKVDTKKFILNQIAAVAAAVLNS